nr:hypothetical protein [Paenibacillus sp. 1011MAR3C5]
MISWARYFAYPNCHNQNKEPLLNADKKLIVQAASSKKSLPIRRYSYTKGIRAVTSIDGMTADWARIPWEVLEKIADRIVNEVYNVNRIVYLSNQSNGLI